MDELPLKVAVCVGPIHCQGSGTEIRANHVPQLFIAPLRAYSWVSHRLPSSGSAETAAKSPQRQGLDPVVMLGPPLFTTNCGEPNAPSVALRKQYIIAGLALVEERV